MIKSEMVPLEVKHRLRAVLLNGECDEGVAIAAALSAWPGMHTHEWQRQWLGGMSGTDLILPLPPPPAGETE